MTDGTLIHSRVMDFDYADNLRSISYHAKFVRGDTPVFEGLMFGGTLGMYTMVKPGAFAITLNQRAYWS